MGGAGVQTVTILISDLVGSTQLAARVGPVAAEALREEHFGLLREAIGEAGGREVKNTGDGLMAAFDSAAAAVECAVLVQQRLEWRNRSATEALQIRIGVSSGDATTAEGDVFGMPVIEATRLCDMCSAGQILAKEIVAHLAAGRGHTFRSVGGLELKGIPEPVGTVEVRWEPSAAGGMPLPQRLRELPTTAYVGRSAERGHLVRLWEEARDGSQRLAMIGGEAGVGKTRLATNLAMTAHGQGATVLYGRCDEDLGVPYQPWTQALGHLAKEAPRSLLDAHVGRFGGELARLAPTLLARLPDLPAPRESDAETERYLLYAAAAGLLESASAREPVLLVLDDLHWADGPTLSLLRHVVVAGPAMRVLIVGTYRDSELSRDHPLASLLADLHREQGVQRIKLAGLEPADVLELMAAAAGHDLGDDGRELAAEITRETAGNPFFAGELLRHLTESGAIVQEDHRWHLAAPVAELGLTQSVREVIGRRVQRLGSDARTALSAAAVIGRDFSLDLLSEVVDVPQPRLLDLLDEGVSASLLRESSEHAGSFTFTHALVEHTLYEDLGSTRRAVLHREVAVALEKLCGDDPGDRLGALAAHWTAAVVSADAAKARHYAERAAKRALEQLAPDEAIRWYLQALELNDQAAGSDPADRCEMLIGLGEAQRQVGNSGFRDTLLGAAKLAQQLGDSDRLCRAVLASSRGFSSRIGDVDRQRVQMLEGASQALRVDDPRRGQVLALLASELHWAREPSRCRELAAEAIEIARGAGDGVELAHALANAIWAIWVPDTLDERRRMTDELLALSIRLDDPWVRALAAFRGCGTGIEAGDRPLVESSLDALRELSASVPQPHIRRVWLIFESAWCLIQGDLPAAERWAIEALEVGSAAGEPDAVVLFGGLLTAMRHLQGRLGELAEQTVKLAGEPGSLAAWRAGGALAMIEAGRRDEAREMALAEDFETLPWDQASYAALINWAEVCFRLRLEDRSEELYRQLAPLSLQLAAPPGNVFGTFAWALGNLAATLARFDQAEVHFAEAAAIEERLHAPVFLARTHASWARALLESGRAEDRGRAETMLASAIEIAERLGAGAVTREVTECQSRFRGAAGQGAS